MDFEQIISCGTENGVDSCTRYRTDPAFDATISRLEPLVGALRAQAESGTSSYLRLPLEKTDLIILQSAAERIQQNFTDVVVLGTGGSSLGAQALCALAGANGGREANFPKLHFPDNLSPQSMTALLELLDLGTAHFIVVSKSGSTAETLVQAALCLCAAQDSLVDTELHRHFSVIVGPGESALRRLAKDYGFSVYDHPGDLGGRFSALSLVGLLPAMIAGIDVMAVRAGAAAVLSGLRNEQDITNIPAAMGAAISEYLSHERGITITVMMPYDSRLDAFARWHQQLWSESLGKDGKGTTPVRALGPVDQHSQLQLFLDGPEDKFLTIITADIAGKGPVVDPGLAMRYGFEYLAGRTVGDLVAAEAKATVQTLIGRGRPVREIRIAQLDPRTMGALMMSMMIETVLVAGLSDVNAFDQPAVEDGKRLTIAYLEARDEAALSEL